VRLCGFSAALLHPLGEDELQALSEYEDERGTESSAKPHDPAPQDGGNGQGGGYRQSYRNERQGGA